MNREQIAQGKVKHIINFRKKVINTKRITPSCYSVDYIERSFGNKLSKLKTAKNKGTGDCKFYPSLQMLAEENNEPNLFEYVNRKQKAISKLIAIFELMKITGKFPSEKDDPDNYKFLRNLKPIKEGKLQGIWYPELDTIATDYGHPSLFGSNLDNTIIEVDITDLMKFYKKNNRNPSQLSESKNERDLYRKLIRLKQIRQGKTVQKWNPELDLILKRAKMKNLFT